MSFIARLCQLCFGSREEPNDDQTHGNQSVSSRKFEAKQNHVDSKPCSVKPNNQKPISWSQVVGNGGKALHEVHPARMKNQVQAEKVVKDVRPSQAELQNISMACARLWELDSNRLKPRIDYEMDVQGGKRVGNSNDKAFRPLFNFVNNSIFSKPTFSTFCSLLDNYNPDQSYREEVTAKEKQEQHAFVEAVSQTDPINYLHNYLTAKGLCSANVSEFKAMLLKLWFQLCNRGGGNYSSSAFEHVFVGEVKSNTKDGNSSEVSGMHNWVQIYLEESKGRLNYTGFILPRTRYAALPNDEQQVLTIQFEWNGVLKKVSTSFIGVSPEFELALYTLCFFSGRENIPASFGPYELSIRVYRWGDDKLAAAFPVAEN